MGSKGNDLKGLKPRRRSQTRRLLQDCVINMAEARREIVQALQHHRSSSTRTATTTTTATSSAACSTLTAKCCYYSLTESMPVPEPIWSTTAPTILLPAVVPSSVASAAAAAMENLEFEWGESQEAAAASHNWWLGFLKTLDGKKKNDNVSRVFGYQDCLELGEGKTVDAPGDQQNSAPDEWLMFPTSDDNQQGDQTATNPLD